MLGRSLLSRLSCTVVRQQQQQQRCALSTSAVRAIAARSCSSGSREVVRVANSARSSNINGLFSGASTAARAVRGASQQALFSAAAAQPAREDEDEEVEVDEVEDGDEDEEDVTQVSSTAASDAEGVEVVVRRKMIRGSWKKLNYLTRLVQGLYATDALAQVAYTKKRKGLVMRDLINLGVVRALQDHDVPIERLRIERAIVNKGPIAKRGRFHARGRTGKNYHRYSHLYLSFREVEPKPERLELPQGFTRTPSWTRKPAPPAGEDGSAAAPVMVGASRARRRAANAAANAARLGGRVMQ